MGGTGVGRRLGLSPPSAAPVPAGVEGEACPAAAGRPPPRGAAAFVWGCRGPAERLRQLHRRSHVAAVQAVCREPSELKESLCIAARLCAVYIFVLQLIICERLNGSVVPEELVFSIYFSRPE